MKGNRILYLIFPIIIIHSVGCGVQQSEFARFQDRVQMGMERNEAALDMMKKDISQLHMRLEKEKEIYKARDENYIRRLADIGAELDTIRRDISSLSAMIDENKHLYQKSMKEIDALKMEIDGLRKELNSNVSDIEGRLTGKLNEVEGSLKGKIQDLEKGRLLEFEKKLVELKEEISHTKDVTSPPPKTPLSPLSKPTPQQKPEPRKEPPSESHEDDLLRYKEAKSIFDEGDYKEARELFRKFLKEFPNSKLADNAQYWIGECYYREGAYEKAIVEYEKVITNYPKGEKVPSALLKQAMAFERLGDKESARFLYQKIIREFPNTTQATRASSDLNRLK